MTHFFRLNAPRTLLLTAALAIGAQGCKGEDDEKADDDGSDKTAVFTNGDGYPELTGPPSIGAPSAQGGGEIDVSIPYDADTGYVRLAIMDYPTTELLIQNWAEEVTGGAGTVSATVSIPSTTTPPDTYYFTFDLCSSDACYDPYKRTTYERVEDGETYTRVGFTSDVENGISLVQDDGPRDSKISIPTFEIE